MSNITDDKRHEHPEPLGFMLRPEVGAISMSGSRVIVALNAVALKRLRLPERSNGD